MKDEKKRTGERIFLSVGVNFIYRAEKNTALMSCESRIGYSSSIAVHRSRIRFRIPTIRVMTGNPSFPTLR